MEFRSHFGAKAISFIDRFEVFIHTGFFLSSIQHESALDSESRVEGSILLWGKFHKNFTSLAQAVPGPIQLS